MRQLFGKHIYLFSSPRVKFDQYCSLPLCILIMELETRRLPELSLVYSTEAQGKTASLVLFKLTSLKRLNTVQQQGQNMLWIRDVSAETCCFRGVDDGVLPSRSELRQVNWGKTAWNRDEGWITSQPQEKINKLDIKFTLLFINIPQLSLPSHVLYIWRHFPGN